MEIRRAAFTAAHLNELPEDVPTYMAMGKACVLLNWVVFGDMSHMLRAYYRYLFKPKGQILAELEESVKAHDSELKSSKKTRENLLNTQESLVKQLQEL